MYKIEVLPSYKRDWKETTDYLINELYAYGTVENLVTRLKEIRPLIVLNPCMFRAYEPAMPLSKNYRVAPLGAYSLFYTVDEQRQTVFLCRVLYGKRDFDQQL